MIPKHTSSQVKPNPFAVVAVHMVGELGHFLAVGQEKEINVELWLGWDTFGYTRPVFHLIIV